MAVGPLVAPGDLPPEITSGASGEKKKPKPKAKGARQPARKG